MPPKKAGKDKIQVIAPLKAAKKKARISAKGGAKTKASVQAYKKPGLLDCPIEIIGLISAALVRDSDELRTAQVIAADLLSLGSCCKALNSPEYTEMIWEPFCATCPPAPSCPLDMGMEVIEQHPLASRAPKSTRTTRQSCKAGSQQSKVEPAASWEDVVMCLDQDPEMVSHEALQSLRRSLNISYTSLMSEHLVTGAAWRRALPA